MEEDRALVSGNRDGAFDSDCSRARAGAGDEGSVSGDVFADRMEVSRETGGKGRFCSSGW